MEEVWKDVPGYEGRYQVSDLGRVRSLDRPVACQGAVKGDYFSNRKGRLLRPGRMPGGHMSVSLGRGGSRCVHELVLLAFVGPPPERYECRHLNGNPSDNSIENLAWGARGENTQDKKWHGCVRKLTPIQVAEIKSALRVGGARGFKANLARKYGVSDSAINDILVGRYHRDV